MVHVRSHIMGLLCCAHPAFCKVLKHTLRHDGWGSCRRCLAFLYACQQAAHMPLLCLCSSSVLQGCQAHAPRQWLGQL